MGYHINDVTMEERIGRFDRMVMGKMMTPKLERSRNGQYPK